MMRVVRLRRGWWMHCTDNEFALLRETVNRGLGTLDEGAKDTLPYKVRKVLWGMRWSMPGGPLFPDEDRRESA